MNDSNQNKFFNHDTSNTTKSNNNLNNQNNINTNESNRQRINDLKHSNSMEKRDRINNYYNQDNSSINNQGNNNHHDTSMDSKSIDVKDNAPVSDNNFRSTGMSFNKNNRRSKKNIFNNNFNRKSPYSNPNYGIDEEDYDDENINEPEDDGLNETDKLNNELDNQENTNKDTNTGKKTVKSEGGLPRVSKLDDLKNKAKDKAKSGLKKGASKAANGAKSLIGTGLKKILAHKALLIGILICGFALALLLLIVIICADDSFASSSFGYDEDAYWWPIGSDTTTSENGGTYATGEPISTVITSVFGFRVAPTDGASQDHHGIDIAPSDGQRGVHNVIAAKAGKIILATSNYGGYGNAVLISHPDGNYTMYGHMDTLMVHSGEEVGQGQVIGKLGSTGVSTGAHLHFEIRVGSSDYFAVEDPLKYVSKENPRPISEDTATSGAFNFSLYKSRLTKNEYIASLKKYSYNANYTSDFKNKASEIYDVSKKYNVNPELVVVFAQRETSFNPRGGTGYNYWGIAVGNDAAAGTSYPTMSSGIKGFSELLKNYTTKGSWQYNKIMDLYNERKKAKCRQGSYGLPNTLEGIQSVYSTLLSNSPNWVSSNCQFMKAYVTYGLMKDHYSQSYYNSRCPSSGHKLTTCELADFTWYQMWMNVDIRDRIFGKA